MGRLIGRFVLAVLISGGLVAVRPASVHAFSGFGRATADATYGRDMTFSVELSGGAPAELELLLDFEGSNATFVAPVTPTGDTASYRWDAEADYVTPNTRIEYRWRATQDGKLVETRPATLLYDDDREGLDWQTATMGDAVLHWVGGAQDQARHFGDLTADAAARAEQLLGHQLDAPLDIFVYETQDQFFGALGPGAREWTGAAAYPELRTVFMYLQGNPQSYLDSVVTHETTHVVFHDATSNPYHQPARWLNEGFATWSEQQNANAEHSLVESQVGNGLLAFEAIGQQFPIGDTAARLAYAEGATLVDLIIEKHGREAISRLAAAYRDGATDADALRAATGESADQLYADYFASFGADQPQPIEPDPLLPSNVRRPDGSLASGAPQPAGGPTARPGQPAPAPPGANGWSEWLMVVPVLLLVGGGLYLARRISRRAAGGG
jgi:hypothetical protein